MTGTGRVPLVQSGAAPRVELTRASVIGVFSEKFKAAYFLRNCYEARFENWRRENSRGDVEIHGCWRFNGRKEFLKENLVGLANTIQEEIQRLPSLRGILEGESHCVVVQGYNGYNYYSQVESWKDSDFLNVFYKYLPDICRSIADRLVK